MKKGFTLIELLAVIVILAVISLILVITLGKITNKVAKEAFKNSVLGILRSGENYIGKYSLDNISEVQYPIIFTCDGTSCSNGDMSLEFSGKVPTGGSVLIENPKTVISEYITNGRYCAAGTKENLIVSSKCSDVDITAPTITGVLDANVIRLTITDNLSGVASYCVTTTNDPTSCEWIATTESHVDHTLSEPAYYYAYAKDQRGNISNPFEFNAPPEGFNYDAEDTQYDAYYACTDGRTLDGTDCKQHYNSNATMCGSRQVDCNCHADYACYEVYCDRTPSGDFTNCYCTGERYEYLGESCSKCNQANSCDKVENQYRIRVCNEGDVKDNEICHHYECPNGGTLNGTICVR